MIRFSVIIIHNDDIYIPFDIDIEDIVDAIHVDHQGLGLVGAYKPCARLFQDPQHLVNMLIRDAANCDEVGILESVAPQECQLSDTQKKELKRERLKII